ncbi:MAG: alpha/beta hydrolase [Lachnospiraceae bacterium]|nr:alpha/beta hydrolase [Lachnospiraceae bacterium]
MKFYEFGKENDITLLLLHGVATTWQLSFKRFIALAKHKYHIIAVAEDGFNTDEPDVDAISVVAEAKKVADYIVANFDGKIDIILGESLGVMIMTEILLDPRIKVHTAIGDGYTILEYPNFRFDFMKRFLSHAIAGFERFAFKHMNLLNWALGEDVKSMLYTKASKATLYNLEYSMMPYRYKYEALNLADSYLWHGEKEIGLKQVLKKIDKSKYHFAHKVFKGRGHGSLLLEPDRLLIEVDKAYKGYKGNIISK